MISSRRQVITEQDRYGGYNRQPAMKAIIDEPQAEEKREPIRFTTVSKCPSIEVPGAEYSFIRPEGSVSYSKRPELKTDYPETAEYIGLVEKPQKLTPYKYPLRHAKSVKREREDVMPSIRNRAYVLKEEEVKREERSTASARTKVILSVYIAIVLVLAAIVIGTGVVVAGMNDSVLSLESELANKNQTVLMSELALDKLSDDTYLRGLASEKNMTKVTQVNEVNATETVTPTVYEARTNWFDQFCDWLSGLMGQ